MREQLEELDIEYREDEEYYTQCPKCSPSRSKTGSRSLSVRKRENGYTVKCFHSNQCEWNEEQIIGNPSFNTVKRKEYTFIPEDKKPPVSDTSILYPYTDTSGNILFYMERYMQRARNNDTGMYEEKKAFVAWSYLGNNEWEKKKPQGKFLYRAPDVLNYDTLFIVEGEKCVDYLKKYFTKSGVITSPNGSGGYKGGDWQHIRNKKVYLVPDCDEPGYAYMQNVLDIIGKQELNNDIYWVDLHDTGDNDIADLIEKLESKNIPNIPQVIYEVIQKVSQQLTFNASNLNNLETYTSASIEEFFNEGKVLGPKIGFTNMDPYVTYPRCGLVIVEGRSHHGKSLLMYNLLKRHLRTLTNKVLYFSYEMSVKEQLTPPLVDGFRR